MTVKKNIIIASLTLCTLLTQAASPTFPQSLIIHCNSPIKISPFNGATCDTFLSEKRITPLVVVSDKLIYEATIVQKHSTPQTYSQQQHISEFEALKIALYQTKGYRFKYWFESQYNYVYPTKEAAWALYWQISDKIVHIADLGGRLQTKVSFGEYHITLTDVLWQEMLAIKNRILKHECQFSSLQK